jgi:hypothetical protein
MGGSDHSPWFARSGTDPTEELPHWPSRALWVTVSGNRSRAFLSSPTGSTLGPKAKLRDYLVDCDRADFL